MDQKPRHTDCEPSRLHAVLAVVLTLLPSPSAPDVIGDGACTSQPVGDGLPDATAVQPDNAAGLPGSDAAASPTRHGRHTPVHDGYRPNHLDAASNDFFMGIFELAAPLAPGESAQAHVRVLALPAQLAAVQQAGGWAVFEGSRQVGQVRIERTLCQTLGHTGPI